MTHLRPPESRNWVREAALNMHCFALAFDDRTRWYRDTFNARVVDVQIALQVFVTGFRLIEDWFRNADGAGRSSGTALVDLLRHDLRTSDETEVRLDAPSDAHPSVPRSCHQDQLAVGRTVGGELLRVAVFSTVCSQRNTKCIERYSWKVLAFKYRERKLSFVE